MATMEEKEAKAPSSGASAVSDAPGKKNRQVKRKPRSQRGGGGGVRNKQNPKMTTVKHGTKGGGEHAQAGEKDDFGGKSGESMLMHKPPATLRVDAIVRPDSFRAKNS
mgnify:CR=1 FL=1